MAETNSRVIRAPASTAPCTAPHRANALASEPPLVKTTSWTRAPAKAATFSRASSIKARAARPPVCTEEALPQTVRARSAAAIASARKGDVAL